MQITEHIHALRIPFSIPIGPGQRLDRFVYAYLVVGQRLCLIDCGVAAAVPEILAYAQTHGGEAIDLAVITHAHPDHMGGAGEIQRKTGCRIAVHAADAPWVEDAERQFRERPIPGFHALVGGSARADILLRDGETIELGDGQTLRVIHTPGHARGHIALYHAQDKTLFCGDAIPMPGTPPIYEDAAATAGSLRHLAALPGVEVLLASWDEPRRGAEAAAVLRRGMEVVRRLHERVRQAKAETPEAVAAAIAACLFAGQGLDGAPLPPIVTASIAAHLRALDGPDLL